MSSLFFSVGCFALLFHGEGFEGAHGVGVVAWDTSLHGSAVPAGEKEPGKPDQKSQHEDDETDEACHADCEHYSLGKNWLQAGYSQA